MRFKLTPFWGIVMVLGCLSSCHVGRYFIYNFANISDYKKFHNTEIEASKNVYHFEKSIDESLMYNDYTSKYFTDNESLNKFFDQSKTVSLVVIQDDKIKYEWYADKWDDQDIVTSFSMSKSMISALVGLALEEGKIKSLDQPCTNYLGPFKNEGFDKITIQHLLDMRTGISYDESYINPFGNVAAGYYGRNLERHVKNLKLKGKPGEEFEYISIATQMLGMIVAKATGQSVSEYFEEKIWTRIGTEFPASWSKDKKQGIEKSFCCVNARTLDFAKFAKMYLNKGVFEEEQIVPVEWIEESVQLHSEREDNFYQNQWWLFPDYGKVNQTVIDYAAQGHLGQMMYISPKSNTIILRFGKAWGGVNWPGFAKQISKNL